MGRHFAQLACGELNDPESGTPHAAAIVFHALTLLAFERRGVGANDLPDVPGLPLESELLNPEDLAAAREEVLSG
jgi:hypothetical protein